MLEEHNNDVPGCGSYHRGSGFSSYYTIYRPEGYFMYLWCVNKKNGVLLTEPGKHAPLPPALPMA